MDDVFTLTIDYSGNTVAEGLGSIQVTTIPGGDIPRATEESSVEDMQGLPQGLRDVAARVEGDQR